MTGYSETQFMSRAAWLYYLGGFNQEETAERLGTTRARVNKLLQLAREEGIVSITIDTKHNGLLEVENRIADRFGLERCICPPALDLGPTSEHLPGIGAFSRRTVGSIAARLLRDFLAATPDAVIGTGWGRTLDQMTRQIAGLNAPKARFVSLMGSLTANSAFNPFEVVQALSRITGGEGYFLPVPFIADSPEAREVLISQTVVSEVLRMARKPDMALISVGELTETSLLHSTGMISERELAELHRAGAVGDTNGIFFDCNGRPVEHELNNRTIAVGLDELRKSHTVLLSGGIEKKEATLALLNSGIVRTLIIDGDMASRICDTG